MNKINLIIAREYLTRVRKKTFLLTTIGVPLIIIAFYALIIAVSVSVSDDDGKEKIAVLDDAGLFGNKKDTTHDNLILTFISGETESTFTNKYKAANYKAFLYISGDTASTNKYVLHSESTVSLTTLTNLEDIINNTVRNKELLANGIDPKKFEKLTDGVKLETKLDTKEGQKDSFAPIAYAVSMVCGFLIYLMLVIYGTQVMRGVTEEKTNRISEVMASSVKPFQLMMGKVIGIGAVGLTQFIIWLVLMLGLQMLLPVIFPEMIHQINSGAAASNEKVAALNMVMNGLSSLPIAKIIFFFLFYFIGGYFMYASIFAAIGSVVSEDPQEAQQFVMPVLMPIILGFVFLGKAVENPDSGIAVFGSLFPLTSPIVMMGRIAGDVPLWQIALSMLLLTGFFLITIWLAARIYRTGILMYGKKATWKELLKWAFMRSK